MILARQCRRRARILAVICATIVLGACARAPGRLDLPGRYLSSRGAVVEVLVLRADGSFVQFLDISGVPEPMVNHGTWDYDDKRAVVDLRGAIVADNGHGGVSSDLTPQSGLWALEARKRNGQITLHWNPDLGFLFRKL